VLLFRDLLLDEDVARVSSCELEVDIVAADILNRHDVDGLSLTACIECTATITIIIIEFVVCLLH